MGEQETVDWSAELGSGRKLVARTATAGRVAEVLRARIIEGALWRPTSMMPSANS
jgi:hypothetical protein